MEDKEEVGVLNNNMQVKLMMDLHWFMMLRTWLRLSTHIVSMYSTSTLDKFVRTIGNCTYVISYKIRHKSMK